MVSSESDKHLIAELLKSMQHTTSLIQTLMTEFKDNAIVLATLESKLESLNENARTLSKIVRDDNGNKSVLTRIALLENDLNDLTIGYKEFKIIIYRKLEESSNRIISNEAGIKIEIDQAANGIKEELERIDSREEKDKLKTNKMIAVMQVSPGVIALILVLIKIIFKVDIGL